MEVCQVDKVDKNNRFAEFVGWLILVTSIASIFGASVGTYNLIVPIVEKVKAFNDLIEGILKWN